MPAQLPGPVQGEEMTFHLGQPYRLAPWCAPALLLLAAACSGGGEQGAGGLDDLGDLRGRAIGFASLDSTAALEVRYVFQAAYGLDARLQGGDVIIVESSADSLETLLVEGEIDAAVMPQLAAFRMLEDDAFRVLAHVSEEMRELTGRPVMSSVLVTFQDVAEQKAFALSEITRLLAESLTYFEANEGAVLEAVAEEQDLDEEFVRWQSERHELFFGDRSVEVQERLLSLWQAAQALGDIEEYPALSAVLFDPDGATAEAATDGDRTTITLALLDDPGRRAALYAIEQGLVTSDLVDIDVTYLTPSALAEAAASRQYDVIEAASLLVPTAAASGLDFVVLSGGLQDLDGTLVFVRSEGED